MSPITLDMIRRRAEHNEGMVSNLEEISLHQQEIEKIEALGHICRHLKILYMQNNLISKLQNLHRLKELEYGNFAVNNIVKIENLQRCESLVKLDLTVNFISKASLLTVHTLSANYKLEDLYLMGNPCADFGGYRPFIIATLPQLKRLDGKDVTPSEKIVSVQRLPEITAQLLKELKADGVDIEDAKKVSDARDLAPDENDVNEIYAIPEDERPWCPATRVAEQRESAKLRDEQDEKKKENVDKLFENDSGSRRSKQPRRESFPDLPEDITTVRQCNEGEFQFRFDEMAVNPDNNEKLLTLEVQVGKFMDTSLMDVDIHPFIVRVLIKGRLLCLTLPEEVKPDVSLAQRSKVTGSLVISMPKVNQGTKGLNDGNFSISQKSKITLRNPGWAASGTGSETSDELKRRIAYGGGGGGGSNKLIKELGAVSLQNIVTDTNSAIGGGLDISETVKAPAPATLATQHAVYGDDSGEEPPPL